MNNEFFLDTDGSCHWYLIPVDKEVEWEIWSNLDEDDSRAWVAPDYAQELGKHPKFVRFTNPRVC